MKLTYLLINLGAVLIPFIFSFHPRLRFDKHWKPTITAIAVVGLIFILWDVRFTAMGIWWFNQDYVLGLDILGLPIEEWLFFICIPYACMFTYHCFGVLIPRRLFSWSSRAVSVFLILGLLTIGAMHISNWYTSVTFIALGSAIGYFEQKRTRWLPQFYFSYLVLIIPFFIVNGLLTGTGLEEPVVLYNDDENLGIRLLTIPVEDIFYGMLLILLNIAIMEKLKARLSRH